MKKIQLSLPWENNPVYNKYMNEEWGVPVYDDKKLFEMLVLETFQTGLSWWTILKKRDGFKKAFANWDYKKVAEFEEDDIEKLLQNTDIVRHKGKIKATIKNAQVFIKIQKEYKSFSKYIWDFVEGKPVVNNVKYNKLEDLPTKTELAVKISKDLKKKEMMFVGTTVVYAYLQAIGIVNDRFGFLEK